MLKTSGDHLTSAFEETKDASDRTLAIVTAVLLENILEDAIVTRLRSLSNTQRSALFDGESGFAGFSAKINLGFAVGLYGTNSQNELNYIRRIRNQFAHHLDRRFDHPEIAKHCDLLNDYSKADPVDPTWSPALRTLLAQTGRRWRYQHAVLHYLQDLLNEMHNAKAPVVSDRLP